MKVLTRYFSYQIYRSIAFTLLAFLSLFAFFDLMNELGSVGRGPYQLSMRSSMSPLDYLPMPMS